MIWIADLSYSSQLEKMFLRRKMELSGRPQRRIQNTDDGDTRAQWANKYTQQGLHVPGAPRTTVDELMHRARRASKSNDSTLMSKSQSGINRVLTDLKPVPSGEDHGLRRSRRSAGLRTGLVEPPMDTLDEPEPEKYSVAHGLGPKWKRPFTYPEIGKKKATLDFSDLEKLDEGEFLNDALVTFYMRYLEHKLEQENPEGAKRIYFFNTFFFQRLTESPKGKKDINYAGVEKWTKKVDIFTYDYVVVPINERAHWYLAIICNLPKLDRKMTSSSNEPAASSASLPPSSPRPGSRESQRLTATTDDAASLEKPSEQITRHSFAEMTLEAGEEAPQDDAALAIHVEGDIPATAAITDDDEMLLSQDYVNEQPLEFIRESSSKGATEFDNEAVQATLAVSSKARAPKSKKKKKPAPPISKTNPDTPMILTFDSLGSTHSVACRVLKDYLYMEGQTKRDWEINKGSIQGITASGIPQQGNFSDCGIYVLGYLDKFLNDGPSTFVPKMVARDYKEEDWNEIDFKSLRSNFRNTIFRLYREASGREPPKAGKTPSASESSLTTPAAGSPAPQQSESESGKEFPSPTIDQLPSTREEALAGAQLLVTEDVNARNIRQVESSTVGETDGSSKEANEDSLIEIAPPDQQTDEPTQEDVSLVISETLRDDDVSHIRPLPQNEIDQLGEAVNRHTPDLPAEIADSQEVRQMVMVSEGATDLRLGSPELELTPQRQILEPRRREHTPPSRTGSPVSWTDTGTASVSESAHDEPIDPQLQILRSSPRRAKVHQPSAPQSPKRSCAAVESKEVANSSKRRKRGEDARSMAKANLSWEKVSKPLPVSATYADKRRRKKTLGSHVIGSHNVREGEVITLDD